MNPKRGPPAERRLLVLLWVGLGGLGWVWLLVGDVGRLWVVLGRLVGAVLVVRDGGRFGVVFRRLVLVGIVDREVSGRLWSQLLCTLVGDGETLSLLLGGVQGGLHGD